MFDISRKAITLFGFDIHFYGIIIVIGVYLAICLSEKREKKMGFEKETVLSLSLWALPAAIICARLYYVLFNFDEYRGNLVSVLDIRSGGMAIYGGLIGGVLAGFIFAGRKKLSFIKLFDLAAPSMALGQAIGRWGNFINQEAYGIQITNPDLWFFPVSVFIPSENAYFAATFFYESAWCFLIVFLCHLFERKRLFRFTGAEACFYVSMYAFERMIVEGLRTDSLYLGPMRISQLLSVIMLMAVVIIVLLKRKSGKLLPLAAFSVLFVGAMVLSVSGILPCFRMIVEGLRTDSLYLGPMRISQLLSVIMLMAVVIIVLLKRKSGKRLPLAALTVLFVGAMVLSVSGILPCFVLIVSGAIVLCICLFGIFR